MTVRKVNVAIIGGGLMGREIASAILRWPALVDHPVRPSLVAACDINPDALAWFREIDTVSTTTVDYRELLSDDAIDVVYVAVRHDLHERIYTDVIRAGKSLLAEKPFGIDRAAAVSLMAAVQDHPGSFVRCSSEMPYFPGAQRAIDHIRSGALGQMVEARCSFLHSSDLDLDKAINWKRQVEFCGAAGVMNDLGMHAWHVPLRLGWRPESVFAVLQNSIPERRDQEGRKVPCDTWDNATVYAWSRHDGVEFPLTIETKRIAPGEKNTWALEAVGLHGAVRFSTKYPKTVEVFGVRDLAGIGREQTWQRVDVGSQSIWPTVTGAIFETGFSDAILQMLAAFFAEREGALGAAFGTVRPQEAAETHAIFEAALRSHEERRAVAVINSGSIATSVAEV